MIANVATARKIAVLFYNILCKGCWYVEVGLKQYDEKFKAHKMKVLQKMAHQLGMEVVPHNLELGSTLPALLC